MMRGFVVKGRFVGRSDLERFYRCRKCRARIGRPYADPLTGELDHARMVCGGEAEHEIKGEGDVMHESLLAWLEAREDAAGEAVLAAYPWLRATPPPPSSALYGDDEFKGFA